MADNAGVDSAARARYVVIEGRRWRASDPDIPPALRAELVSELMAARRAVRHTPATARPRVHDAKVALGERGEPWWEPTDAGRRERLLASFRTLLRHRPEGTVCPSEPARIVGGAQWRALMPAAREVAAAAPDLQVLRGGEPVTGQVSGPVRVGRGEGFAP